MSIIDTYDNSINFSKMQYLKPTRHSKYYMSDIKYDGSDMTFDTPFLRVVKNNFYDEGSFFTISFALLNNKSCKNFFKTIYDIEEYNCIMIQQESENWFGKKNYHLMFYIKKTFNHGK